LFARSDRSLAGAGVRPGSSPGRCSLSLPPGRKVKRSRSAAAVQAAVTWRRDRRAGTPGPSSSAKYDTRPAMLITSARVDPVTRGPVPVANGPSVARSVAGYGTGVDLDVIRAWWSLRSLQAVRWLVEHGFARPRQGSGVLGPRGSGRSTALNTSPCQIRLGISGCGLRADGAAGEAQRSAVTTPRSAACYAGHGRTRRRSARPYR